MRERKVAPSIWRSMVQSVTLYILLPLFLALTVLCFLLKKKTDSGIEEAMQMMFAQNVQEIDSAILLSNYASSTMITYMENSRFLKNYYNAKNEYAKNRAVGQIEGMILNTNVSTLGSIEAELMIFMNDGKKISSTRIAEIPEKYQETAWYQNMQKSGQIPYWDSAMTPYFDYKDNRRYVSFGRALVRYRGNALGYALVRIPRDVFFGKAKNSSDSVYRGGTVFMCDQNGRIVTSGPEELSPEIAEKTIEVWRKSGEKQGKIGNAYVLSSDLTSSNNQVVYVGDYHEIFAQSEQIQLVVILFMAGAGIALVTIMLMISRYITNPILFFARQVDWIEQNDPKKLTLEENRFLETQALENGMICAQSRIAKLMEDVRREAVMKEKARFDALKAQINPHFLFNTLNAIRWKASMNHDEEVADVLSELGVLLSETYKSDEEMESIGNAVRILNAYVKIMQIRFGNKVQFFFSIPENIRKYQIPRFCLQPLVENSFIHGMSHVECGVIALRGEMQGTDIVLTLIDNGEGLRGKTLDLNREEPGKRGLTGIGLPNIHKRLTGLFGAGYGLAIDTEIESGFRVSLRIPAIEEKGDENESADC